MTRTLDDYPVGSRWEFWDVPRTIAAHQPRSDMPLLIRFDTGIVDVASLAEAANWTRADAPVERYTVDLPPLHATPAPPAPTEPTYDERFRVYLARDLFVGIVQAGEYPNDDLAAKAAFAAADAFMSARKGGAS
jgi:hypothetical protein